MKQYCKYCSNAHPYGDSHCWCDVKNKMISEASASKVNNCKSFDFNEMNVFDIGQIYKPRSPRKEKIDDGEQISLI